MGSTATAALFSLVRDDLVAVEGALVRAVESEGPLMRRLLGMVLPGSGNRLRPALALTCARVNHYDRERLIPFAAALEMLHTATLVHDDIVDESAMRRGEPTLAVRVSNSVAVLVGDYMFAQSAAHTAATGHLGVITSFARTSMEIIGGQVDEAWSDGELQLTREQYLRRIGSKTAALFALAAQGGAMLSNAPDAVVEALRQYGYSLGLAFQIVDDILGIWGDPAITGKPAADDIRSRKKSFPILCAMETLASRGDGELARLMAQPTLSDDDVAAAIRCIEAAGGRERAAALAEEHTRQALAALERAVPPSPARHALRDLALMLVSRDH